MITTYTYTDKDLEDYADLVKVAIVREMVNDGLVDKDAADDWCASHTVIRRKKGLFRTLTNLWSDTELHKGMFLLVVGMKQ